MQNPNNTTLDVREDFQAGRSPCEKIKSALGRVGPDEALRLLVPFEPVPLFELAAIQGLTHSATRSPAGDWEVLFTRVTVPTPPTATAAVPVTACGCDCAGTANEIVDVDARGLEPPQPMVIILEALASQPKGNDLRARTDRRSLHLYPMLEARGFPGKVRSKPMEALLRTPAAPEVARPVKRRERRAPGRGLQALSLPTSFPSLHQPLYYADPKPGKMREISWATAHSTPPGAGTGSLRVMERPRR